MGDGTMELTEWNMLPDIGLYMDQVITLLRRAFDGVLPEGEITKSMVNNYVKAGLLRRPEGKKYGREHLAMLMEIAVLKQALSMEEIAAALDTLCAQGVREGYERFLSQVRALQAGDAVLEIGEADGEQALTLSITAAVYTIRAKCALAAAQKARRAQGAERKEKN